MCYDLYLSCHEHFSMECAPSDLWYRVSIWTKKIHSTQYKSQQQEDIHSIWIIETRIGII